MNAILGIDAAWTETGASGVALVERGSDGWRCRAVAPDYRSFLGLAEGKRVRWNRELPGSKPDPPALLRACRKILDGGSVDLVMIDMPVSTRPFFSRRPCDDLVSREYGARGCSVHSPDADRPGPMGARLTRQFAKLGFPVATANTEPGTPNSLVEVFPHAALLTLLRAEYRIPYKVRRTIQLWPDASYEQRRENVIMSLTGILKGLKREIKGIRLRIPSPAYDGRVGRLLSYENALDALVCAWVGIKYSEGDATAYGDHVSAIWIPESMMLSLRSVPRQHARLGETPPSSVWRRHISCVM